MRHNIYVKTFEIPEGLSTEARDTWLNRQLARLRDGGFGSYVAKPIPASDTKLERIDQNTYQVIYESSDPIRIREDLDFEGNKGKASSLAGSKRNQA